nr:hypothetical protein HK105_003583 [Polyrhizophydium stewartii]
MPVQGGYDDGIAGIVLQQHPKHHKHSKHRAVNNKLGFGEHDFIDMAGTPSREWSRHAVHALAEWSAHGTEVFPAIREATRRGDSTGTDKIIASVAGTLRRAAGRRRCRW